MNKKTQVEMEKPVGPGEVEVEADRLLTISAAAKIFGKHRTTVWRWIMDGLLTPVKMPSGLYAVRESEVRKFLGCSALNNPLL